MFIIIIIINENTFFLSGKRVQELLSVSITTVLSVYVTMKLVQNFSMEYWFATIMAARKFKS